MKTPFLVGLRRRFSPSQYLKTRDGIEQTVAAGRAGLCVLSRDSLLFFSLDCAKIPENRREQYVAVSVARRFPLNQPRHAVLWESDTALVWAWPKNLELEILPASVTRIRYLPETLFRGDVREQGAELVSMITGVEGRIWSQGRLKSCHWWKQLPDLEQWTQFLRASGLPAPDAVPMPETSALRVEPWRSPSRTGQFAGLGRYRSWLVPGALALATAILTYGVGGYWRLHAAIQATEAEIAGQDRELRDILDARERADTDSNRIEDLLSLRPPASQLTLMTSVIGAIPDKKAQILQWQMADRRNLQILLKSPGSDLRALVSALDSLPLLSDVTAEPTRNLGEVMIRAHIVPSLERGKPQ